MERRRRVLVAVLLLGGVVGMGVHYDAAYEEHWPYPAADDLAESDDAHVGEQVRLFGTVESVDEQAGMIRIRVYHDEGEFTMAIRDTTADVGEGGTVQVLGTLQQNRALDADAVTVVNPSGASTLYKYAISLLGALLVAGLFFKHWRVSIKRLSIEAR